MMPPTSSSFLMPLAVIWKTITSPFAAVLRATGMLKNPVMPDVDLSHRVVIVTGANTGIGSRTALHLAKMGATVVMACRSVQKGEEARAALEKEMRDYTETRSTVTGVVPGPAKGGVLEVLRLDLGDLESVRAFAAKFKAKYTRLDVLVNNAGLSGTRGLTADGLDVMFGVNFVGHFALTSELMTVIESTPFARVVCLASVMHHFGCTQWDDAMGGHKGHRDRSTYSDSKLAMVLFAKELRRRFAAVGSTATAFAVNPGAVRSDIWRWVPSTMMPFYNFMMQLLFLSTEQGCRPSVFASVLPLEKLSGSVYYQPYWLPFGWSLPFELLGVYIGYAPAKPSVPKNEPAASAELWGACERILQTAGAARSEVR